MPTVNWHKFRQIRHIITTPFRVQNAPETETFNRIIHLASRRRISSGQLGVTVLKKRKFSLPADCKQRVTAVPAPTANGLRGLRMRVCRRSHIRFRRLRTGG
jgi:hypothetical protein